MRISDCWTARSVVDEESAPLLDLEKVEALCRIRPKESQDLFRRNRMAAVVNQDLQTIPLSCLTIIRLTVGLGIRL